MKSNGRAGIRAKTLFAVVALLGILAATVGLADPASAQPYTEATIHSFVPAPFGADPQAPVIQASDGNLYGTTAYGGSRGRGTVFKISNPTTAPAESVIYNFTGGSDGGNPQASLIQLSDGNLYGTTLSGGSSGSGTIFKISNPTTAPVESVIYSFTGGSDGADPQASVIQASDGNLYGTTVGGGSGGCAFGCGTVFKISNPTTSPAETVVYSFTGGSDGSYPHASLIQTADGSLYGTTAYGGSADAGTVFKISNPATSPTESVIYSFTGGADGGYPFASLLQASDGNLYGSTSSGGSCVNCGTLYKISNPTTSPTFSVIYSFTPGGDGQNPNASVIQASDGNFYGTTSGGGSTFEGTVFKISNPTTSPVESVIYTFPGGGDGANPYAPVIQASDGNLYGTAAYGGGSGCGGGPGSGCGVVLKISNPATSPTESLIYSFTGGADGISPPAALIQASDGNLYGTTESGGSNSVGAVFKITDLTTSPTESVIYTFAGGTDGSYPGASLIQASDGNLYGTTYSGGAANHGTVFKISNPTIAPTESVIYSFAGGSDGDHPQASLLEASDGNLYGTTTYGGSSGVGTVFKISNPANSPTESVIYSFSGGTDGSLPHAALIQGSDGNLYGTTYDGGSMSAGTVFKISNPTTSPVESLIYDFTGSDGGVPLASLIQASDGNLYGTTYAGGSANCFGSCGAVFKIANPTTSPAYSVIYSFVGAPDGSNPESSLIQASDGNLYGTTYSGGLNNCFGSCGTVFAIGNPTTSPVESVIYTFAGIDGGVPLASLIQASDGKLYGTTYHGGTAADGVVFSIGGGCLQIRLGPSVLASGLVNAPYSQSVSASGGTGPYTYAITAGTPPSGLSLDGLTGVISGTPTIAGASTFTVTTTDANGCTASRGFTVTVNAAAVRYYTIAPCRLIDTRRPAGTYGGPALQGSGAQRSFPVDGQCGIPVGAVAVSANVTVVGSSGRGDLRMFSAGTPTPAASVINFNAGQTRASNAILPMVGNPVGSLTVQCDIPGGTTNMLLDVNGYFQ